MNPLSTSEIRRRYLDFYQTEGHAVIDSDKLLPENDPTTLFTGSGMQPMLRYLLGEKHPRGNRIADSQKCFRSQDIEEVGDNRHTTFFEMLGNWSLGDYFKREQLPWIFRLLTESVGLDPSRLYVTVFRGNNDVARDDESIAIWKDVFGGVGINATDVDFAEKNGMQGGRIFPYDEKKNWWSRAGEPSKMPVGEPGGPDSEMFFDFGAERKLHETSPWKDLPCHVNCDCGRFLEIGNSVFMQYRKTGDGFEELPQRNVDFGGGLERISAALRNDPDVFQIDLFDGLREKLASLGAEYGKDTSKTTALRIIMDHLRGATFLIADGAPPGNRDQGYFTRRLIRRAVRFGNRLNLQPNFCTELGRAVIETYKEAYPSLPSASSIIGEALEKEEAQFRQTLSKGEKELTEYFRDHESIDGGKVFFFYETYGFPRELTEELTKELGKSIVHPEQYDKAIESHQDLSRTAAAGKFSGGLADHSDETTKLHTATHLLNHALRTVLGDHVFQKGSNITAERLRFDFTHGEKMTAEQIKRVEELVNEAINADVPVSFSVMTVDEAKAGGAIGVFGDKYGEKVKVYTMGAYSKEICGGPHVARTGMLGSFKIQKEESSSSGVRRIKGVVSGGPKKIEVAEEM